MPKKWTSDSADITREEKKREQSPSSFFYSQGKALVLAAKYFQQTRLAKGSRGGVAHKHLHRIHLALFGQLMAAFEFLLKDFIACVVDMTSTFDAAILQAKWLEVDTNRILTFRSSSSTPGSVLLHTSQGWYDSETVIKRYSAIFQRSPIQSHEITILDGFWILRHSIAHNAGFVAAYDAARSGIPHLADAVVDIDDVFIEEAFNSLCDVAQRIALDVGDAVVIAWLKSLVPSGKNYQRDKEKYRRLKLLATYVGSRSKDLPVFNKSAYAADFKRAI